MENQLSLFAFTVMVEQMRTAQRILSSELEKESNKDIKALLEESLIIKQAKRITRDLELVVDQTIKENYAVNAAENGSFVTSEYIRVYCCKCEEMLTLDGDNYACFNDMDEAKSSLEMNDWKLEGNQATCDECLEKEEVKKKWGGDLFDFFGEHINSQGWLTTEWADILEKEIQDQEEKKRFYSLMYKLDYETSEDETSIRPVDYQAPPLIDYAIGQTVEHGKLGLGKVLSVEGESMLIEFSDKTRKMSRRFFKDVFISRKEVQP